MTALKPIESFCCAYWDYLRGLRKTEPCAAEFGLCECSAEALARLCHYEFNQAAIQKAIETKVA